jgi:hypothetical protein
MLKFCKLHSFATALVLIATCTGCSWLKPKTVEPTNNFRSDTGGTSGTGFDDRARQIESNLGLR